MKLWLTKLLVVVLATSSVNCATDTLTITSHRIVNPCSGEKRWLISADIGEVFESDSLMSFDITIGFDTSLLRPTDGLFTGTLSEQMKFGDISPGVNFRVPGEMRVSAFTITRNVKGKLPLFAVAGDYLGQCGSEDSLTLPWVPEFNQEFKKWTRVFVSTKVISRATPVPSPEQGTNNTREVVVLSRDTPSVNIPVVVQATSNDGSRAKVEVSIEGSRASRIDSVTSSRTDALVEINSDRSTASIEFKVTKNTDTINVSISSMSFDSTTSDVLKSALLILDSCSCSTPTATGSTAIRFKNPPVSVKMDLNESSSIVITSSNDNVTVKSLHGDPLKIVVSDLLGRTIFQSEFTNHGYLEIPTTEFGPGLFLVAASTLQDFQTRLYQR